MGSTNNWDYMMKVFLEKLMKGIIGHEITCKLLIGNSGVT